jgi:hypothetical protein
MAPRCLAQTVEEPSQSQGTTVSLSAHRLWKSVLPIQYLAITAARGGVRATRLGNVPARLGTNRLLVWSILALVGAILLMESAKQVDELVKITGLGRVVLLIVKLIVCFAISLGHVLLVRKRVFAIQGTLVFTVNEHLQICSAV